MAKILLSSLRRQRLCILDEELNSLIDGSIQFKKPQGYESRLVLAGHAAGLSPSIGNACTMQVEEINLKTYALEKKTIQTPIRTMTSTYSFLRDYYAGSLKEQ